MMNWFKKFSSFLKKKNRNDRISGMKKCTKRLKITLVKVVEKDMPIKEVAKTMTSLSH